VGQAGHGDAWSPVARDAMRFTKPLQIEDLRGIACRIVDTFVPLHTREVPGSIPGAPIAQQSKTRPRTP
jgi:hypothetical protein